MFFCHTNPKRWMKCGILIWCQERVGMAKVFTKGGEMSWRWKSQMCRGGADGSYFNLETYLAFSIFFLLKTYLIGSVRNIDNREEEGGWYIYYDACLFVTKNDHFLLGVSCNHLNPPSPPCTTPGQFWWFQIGFSWFHVGFYRFSGV